MAKTSEDKERFIALRARGYSYARISDLIGVSKPTLIKWNRQFREQIAQMESDELETLCERFRVARAHRVERFANLLDRIEVESAGRDLSLVETDRLIRLYLRVMESLRRELEPDRMEVTGKMAVEDPLARWEAIIREALDPDSIAALADGAKSLLP